jgi:16S rRNA (cytosine967-C5)-methyltransferase
LKWWSSQLGNIRKILKAYKGDEAFHMYIKAPLKQLRAGSKDRRVIRDYSFNYLRLSRLFADEDLEMAIITANALLQETWTKQLLFYIEQLPDSDSIKELEKQQPLDRIKSYCVSKNIELESLFPATEMLSDQIEKQDFLMSLTEPKPLFVWCKKDSFQKITTKLSKAKVDFETIEGLDDAIKLPSGVNLDQVLGLDQTLVEVQDISSQLALVNLDIEHDSVVWDCCAGSGGKSMHLASRVKGPIWLLSDKREKILHNLRKRIKSVTKYFAIANHDILSGNQELVVFKSRDEHTEEIKKGSVDWIIADVPCTGSGTWARNPEHLAFFAKRKIAAYAMVQVAIINSAWNFLRSDGKLVYMTCSVYKRENEDVIENFLSSNPGAHLESMQYFGQNEGGDILFQAVLSKTKD